MPAIDETARRFRKRTRECRRMAEEVKEPDWIKWLLGLAEDLENEADKIEDENAS